MKSIKILGFKSSELNAEFQSITSVEVADESFGSGSFGEVFICHSINGKPLNSPQVIKRLNDDGNGSASAGYQTILQLQNKMLDYNSKARKNGDKRIDQIIALEAIPQFSFEGEMDNEKIVGYSANYLNPGQYLLFDKLFNNQDAEEKKRLRNHFYNLPVNIRLKMAYDMAEGFKCLQQMSYVHADLNPSNFMVSLQEGALVIIDYDSGAVIENKRNDATTFGKMGEWLAPEIQQQLVQTGTGNIKVNLHTDTWSVAIAIHFLLFNFHPLFYLKKRGLSQMDTYFNVENNRWPEIELTNSNFHKERREIYQDYRANLKNNLPAGIVECFSETINSGYYNPDRRISYGQWMRRIDQELDAPVIIKFDPDKEVVVSGARACLKWNTMNEHILVIDNGVGDVTGKTEIWVQPSEDTTYVLTAIGFGEVKEQCMVKVLPLPELKILDVPIPSLNIKFDIGIQPPPVEALPINAITLHGLVNVQLPEIALAYQSLSQNSTSMHNSISTGLDIGSIFNEISKKINP